MKSNPDTSLHILIVEDNRTQAEYLRHLLEKRGHQVTVSQNGFEALERIEEKRPDIILTDVMMPDMDGYTLCKTVKQHEKFHDIPVILVTHLYSPVDVIKGLEAGADNFIIKPYDPEYIFSRITGIMQAKNHPGTQEPVQPLDVVFSSEVHTIASSRMQILNILLSTYETAVKNNSELQVAHERLHYTNAQLQKLIEDLEQTNESLHLKNLERGRLETALAAAHEKIEILSEALKQIYQIRVQPADEILSVQASLPDVGEGISTASSHLHAGMIALKNIRQYIRTGTMPRTWLGIRNSINNTIDRVRRQSIRYENLIPEDIEIYADPCFEHVLSDLIVALQDGDEKPTEMRFSFHVKENGYVIICENNDQGIAETDKEKIFTFHHGLLSHPSLCLIREMLALSGMDIAETGIQGHRTRFEIGCPESSVRFGSDIQDL
ncbi:response regulator receiver domain protein (CheY-like) [Methanospirillum hungatei JF-1]|uniref:Response regulator receiver domain protein (CheY-like) n=1 Tax=Methanospirillum hungatei JF-1 (strain ATCC 27890 / DSM 864 / NBRC 100397 / JF-1) TaxID=323259 RepID=Q2FT91_METHJ|nr:response regulator [Methanospirillum hungatei]ABD42444.1 response regulator receiver domain protein (CheY-like) [Methanospirillum hungatei JF-1]